MSFFGFERVAEGYASHRPYYHPLVMNKIRQHLKLRGVCDQALDVGCGNRTIDDCAQRPGNLCNGHRWISRNDWGSQPKPG